VCESEKNRSFRAEGKEFLGAENGNWPCISP